MNSDILSHVTQNRNLLKIIHRDKKGLTTTTWKGTSLD